MQKRFNPIDGAVVVWVPAGAFVMGSDAEATRALWLTYDWDAAWWRQVGGTDWLGELWPHTVELDSFYMYRDPLR